MVVGRGGIEWCSQVIRYLPHVHCKDRTIFSSGLLWSQVLDRRLRGLVSLGGACCNDIGFRARFLQLLHKLWVVSALWFFTTLLNLCSLQTFWIVVMDADPHFLFS
jgi:hypothetical protein